MGLLFTRHGKTLAMLAQNSQLNALATTAWLLLWLEKKFKKKCQIVGMGAVQNDEDSTSRDQPEGESMMEEVGQDDLAFENIPLKTDHFGTTDSLLETHQLLPYGKTLLGMY